jgi:hypothetical protein
MNSDNTKLARQALKAVLTPLSVFYGAGSILRTAHTSAT